MNPELPDFETMMAMAEKEPEKLESLRQSMVAALIDSAPSERIRKRLRGLEFQIEVERQRAKTPMASCIAVSTMMHDSFADLCRALVAPDTIQKENKSADVIDLQKR